jgi:hypothetical protein
MTIPDLPQEIPAPRRTRKLICVTEQQFLTLLQGGETIVVPHLYMPEGARIVGVQHSIERGGWLVCLEHESFPDIPAGECLPVEMSVWQIEYTRIDAKR